MNLDLLLKIVSTLATLAIGIAASMLAYRQYSINRAKLRFDLYEKRIALLSTLGQFISEVVVGDFTMSSEQSQRVTQLYKQTIEHQFLFSDPKVNDYFVEVVRKARELHSTLQRLQSGHLPEKEYEALKEKHFELHGWFHSQTRELFEVFKNEIAIPKA